jgi:hypothetical protein
LLSFISVFSLFVLTLLCAGPGDTYALAFIHCLCYEYRNGSGSSITAAAAAVALAVYSSSSSSSHPIENDFADIQIEY